MCTSMHVYVCVHHTSHAHSCIETCPCLGSLESRLAPQSILPAPCAAIPPSALSLLPPEPVVPLLQSALFLQRSDCWAPSCPSPELSLPLSLTRPQRQFWRLPVLSGFLVGHSEDSHPLNESCCPPSKVSSHECVCTADSWWPSGAHVCTCIY